MPVNETSRQARIVKLAALDFAHAPMSVIREELKLAYSHLHVMRRDPVYLETVEELKQGWKEKILNSPHTNEIAKTISYALGIATKKLVHILSSSKTSDKDVISAARLIAQMDGRFLGQGIEEEAKLSREDAEEVATELKQLIDRHKQAVQ
jgi:DNA-directed RNA polymerase specialized sigma24 family protein